MKETILDMISEVNPKAMKADGFDDAIIGMSTRIGDDSLIAYDYDKCIEILQREMSYEEAVEYMEFNIVGSYVGEGTPIFIKKI